MSVNQTVDDAGYRVRLDAFEGPLDLLLYLIRRDEIDIHDIPIAKLAEQYLLHLEDLDRGGSRVDIDTAGEFLVVAATLMEVKSRMIAAEGLPEGEEGDAARRRRDGDDRDPRAELVDKLLAYKRYRDAAEALEHRREDWARRVPVARTAIESDAVSEAIESMGEVELEDISLGDLVEAFGRIMSSVNLDRLGEHEVTSDDTPIELHAEDIVDRVRRDARAGEYPLRRVFEGRSRAEMVGLFLAMLDLVRNRRVAFRQAQTEEAAERGEPGEIMLRLQNDPDADEHEVTNNSEASSPAGED